MESSTNDIAVDRDLDLSCEVCPYTFVRSKLVMETMASGQVLAVKVDNGESAANVPRSMELEGHVVQDVEKISGGWRIVVKIA
jgi:tRNA 2-thiouridine synthesizing protein A